MDIYTQIVWRRRDIKFRHRTSSFTFHFHFFLLLVFTRWIPNLFFISFWFFSSNFVTKKCRQHSTLDLSMPTILWARGLNPKHNICAYHIIFGLWYEKDENKQKEAGFCLNKNNCRHQWDSNTDQWSIRRAHLTTKHPNGP